MGFFTSRERGELGKPAETRVQEQEREREVVRHDFAPRPRRRPAENDISGHVGTLMRRVAESSVQEIDDLIARLQRRREQLLSESERVQREIIEYAQMSQTTMESTKIISESLAHFNKVPDAPRMSEFHLGDDSDAEQRNSGAERDEGQRDGEAEPFAQHDEDHGTSGGEAEGAAVRGGARSETA